MAGEGGMAINRGLRGARWIWGVDGFAHIYAGSSVLLRQGIAMLIMSVSIFENYGGEKLARSGRDGLQC